MNILSLTYEYPPIGGGGSVVAAALNETLVAMGHRVDVVTSAMPDLQAEETVCGVEVHRVHCWRRYRHYSTLPELVTTLWPTYQRAAALIRNKRPDVIHAHFVFPTGVVAYLLSRKFGVPYVLTAHGSDVPGYNPDRFGLAHLILLPLWRTIVRGAAAITSPSVFLTRLLKCSIEIDNVTVIPNGYSAEVSHGLRKRNLVLVVSRMFPRKGVQHFIDSMRGVKTDWEIVVAGDGPYLAALKHRASENHVSIRFTGFLDKRSLRELYEEASILVFPSTRENFPVVLLEAMDAGCAIVTTSADGCAEVVGDAAVIVEVGNPRQIRSAVEDLINNRERRELLSRRALERARAYRWSAIAEAYLTTFGQVTGVNSMIVDDLSDTVRMRRLELAATRNSGDAA